jgi:hypothetical protein
VQRTAICGDDQPCAGGAQLFVEPEQAALPVRLAGDPVEIVDAHDVQPRELGQRIRRQTAAGRQRQVGSSLAGFVSRSGRGLQQVAATTVRSAP